jgi:hypothetical protein
MDSTSTPLRKLHKRARVLEAAGTVAEHEVVEPRTPSSGEGKDHEGLLDGVVLAVSTAFFLFSTALNALYVTDNLY